jgi:hypothetical protein
MFAAELPWGGRLIKVVSAEQADLGIEVDVWANDQVNTYCNTVSLRLLAHLFDACAGDGQLAVLNRHAPAGADLVIFRGTDTPVDFTAYRRLRDSLQKVRKIPYTAVPACPEMDSDRRTEHWRQRGLITVRTQDHVVLLGGTGHGLRLCALDCLDLAVPGSSDHVHWADYWLGTSKTVEFIIRNQDNA